MNTVCLSDKDLYRKTSIQNGSTAFMYIVQIYKDLVFFFSMDAQERFERFVELCCLICACICANISCILLSSSSFSASILSLVTSLPAAPPPLDDAVAPAPPPLASRSLRSM